MFEKSYIIWSVILYVLYVLLPMIPAIQIYKRFPEDRASVEGLLGQYKIKVLGAFAAYIITAGMGFFIIQHILHQIDLSTHVAWRAEGNIYLMNSDSSALEFGDYFNKNLFIIETEPDFYTKSEYVTIDLPSGIHSTVHTISISLPGFKSAQIPVDLSSCVKDPEKMLIKLGEIILIKEQDAYLKVNENASISDTLSETNPNRL